MFKKLSKLLAFIIELGRKHSYPLSSFILVWDQNYLDEAKLDQVHPVDWLMLSDLMLEY
jgi:hypothetical protein